MSALSLDRHETDDNRLLNHWARTVFVTTLQRRARLARSTWSRSGGGYSSTIGNLAFEAPDACASAAEIARRGIARLAGIKGVLPAFGEGTMASLRKDLPLPVDAVSWADVHWTIKAAKIGYRRPHPDVPKGTRDFGENLLVVLLKAVLATIPRTTRTASRSWTSLSSPTSS